MKILLIAATEMEFGILFHESEHEIEYFTSGVGLTQTAFRLGQKLKDSQPDLCIQIGIAGSFDKSLGIGDVVIIKRDCFADLGARDRDGSFLHLTQILPCNQENPFEQYFLQPEIPIKNLKLPLVNAISVNKVHGFQLDIDQIKSQFDAQIESMEGAAFFAVCMTLGIPCLQIRSISNYVEPRNKSNWQIGLALKNLHRSVIEILKEIE